MGGGLNMHKEGPYTPPPPSNNAEWNFYSDPLAANITVGYFRYLHPASTLVSTNFTHTLSCGDVEKLGPIKVGKFPTSDWENSARAAFDFMCDIPKPSDQADRESDRVRYSSTAGRRHVESGEGSDNLVYDGTASLVFLHGSSIARGRVNNIQVGTAASGVALPAGVCAVIEGARHAHAQQCAPLPNADQQLFASVCHSFGKVYMVEKWVKNRGASMMYDLLA
mmetsp:Transcript_34644/g.89859  ORF Transcript_34644/g.89859 Transcript_34644/m.89859 type:complete len:223 (-) Transcript_34644:2271-2939(-)